MAPSDTKTRSRRGPDPQRPAVVALESKMRPPTPRREWVQRSRLISRLMDEADKKLILVEAPAGYGKTILLAQWQASPGEVRPCAWITLDSEDDDPVRLWTYIVEALRRLESGLGDHITEVGVERADQVKEVVLPRLMNELAVLPRNLVVVLDDYHQIKDRACHETVDFFLANLPKTTHVVLATRSDPPLRLSRGAARHDTVTISAADLRFDRDEAAQLLDSSIEHELPDEVVDRLLDRTEGWPAGLYLAALSLKDRTDPRAFIDHFAGDNRLVVDYLTAEVLNQQSDSMRRFLLRTSILDRFTPSACDAVAGVRGSAEMLDELARSNLFLVPLDDSGSWYRYHRLFQDLLRSELKRSDPELLPQLHRRASEWHRRWGYLAEAIDHATAAEDVSTLRELIGASWYPYWQAGRVEDVRGWLDVLGRERVASDAPLALVAAWTAGLTGRRDEFERWIARAEHGSFEGPLPDGMASLESGTALIRALMGSATMSAALKAARRAVDLERAGNDPRWFAEASTCLGYFLYLSGDLEAAKEPLLEVTEMPHTWQRSVVMALAVLSFIAAEEGRAGDEEELGRRAIALCLDLGLNDDPTMAPVHLAAGLAALDAENHAEASFRLEHTLDLARRSPWLQPWVVIQSLLGIARLRIAQRDHHGSVTALEEVGRLLERNPESGTLQKRFGELEGSLDEEAALAESLTDRELAVLKLLPTPYTQREIGAQLYLSINTVKSHTRSIFRKLGVGSREEAVLKARQSGLL